MARVVAIEPRRTISAATASEGLLSLSGALSSEVSAGPPISFPPVVKSVAGALTPSGSLATEASGPSIDTILKSLAAQITPIGTFADEIVDGPPIGISTKEMAGSLGLSGTMLGEATGPSLVVVEKVVVGGLGLGGEVVREAITPEPPPPTILTQDADGTITPAGDVTTDVSGPSIETLTQDVDGTITPAGDLTTDVIDPPVTTFTKSVGGQISPVGSIATAKSGPSFVTVPKAVSGSIALTGATAVVIAPTFATKTQNVTGAITPAGALTTATSGPSIETKLKSLSGSITPHGAKTDLVIAPPPTFFSKDTSGVITPTGALTRVVTGPSIETKVKAVNGIIVPSSSLARQVNGPSFVTVPKLVIAQITPVGVVTRQVIGNPITVTKSVAGTITPHGTVARTVISGPPTSLNPLYVHMGNWELADFDLPPPFNSILFSPFPNTTSQCSQWLAGMRSRNMKGGLYVGAPQVADRTSSGGFIYRRAKMQARIDTLAAVTNIASYISNGELEVLVVGDEMHHGKWGGTFTPNEAYFACQYAKQKLPGIKTAFRMPYERLVDYHITGGDVNDWQDVLDYGWAAYTGPFRSQSVGMTAAEYFEVQDTQLATAGLGIITSGNWWNGGDGSSGIEGPRSDPDGGEFFWVMSPQEVKTCCDAAIARARIKYHGYWTSGLHSNLGGADDMAALQQTAPYQAAWKYCVDAGAARGSTNPPSNNFFTDTGFFAAPHPPPPLALGTGVRDQLTNHKVFRLVDNARLQDSEYVALNSDNSVIYYIKNNVGYIADVVWNVGQSSVQVSNERVAVGTTNPAPVVDGWIWSRSSRQYGFFTALPAQARICRRDINLGNTTILKNFSQDTRYTNFWNAIASTSTKLSGLHANRLQEVFCARIHNNSTGTVHGVVVWRSTDNALWNYQPPAGKVVSRVLMDDAGEYVSVRFTDGTWQNAKLETGGLLTRTSVEFNGPVRDDIASVDGSQQAFQGSGIGLRTWDLSPIPVSPSVQFAHPLRNAKVNSYEQGALCGPAQDRVVYFLYHSDTVRTTWQLHAGATYKINWSVEQAAATYKLDPEVVRINGVQLTKVAPPV